jgi:molybdopterin-guanine dinucleotide biosynthesis protein A
MRDRIATPAGGIILCGGESSRMGRPKAWLPFRGEPLLCRVARVLGEAVSPVVVVAAAGQELPPLPDGVRVVRDETPGRGPLEGMAAGLEAAGVPSFVSACDVPFLEAAFVRRMVVELGDDAAVIPEAGGRRHTLSGVYRATLVPLMRGLLAAGVTRPGVLFERCRVRFVAVGDEPSLRNVNTPAEYEAAVRDMEGPAG